KKNNALFILDETITGFRFDLSGAQKVFGVTPDLATFGKGISNGMPLSAVVGKADIMKIFEEVFFSFTFGGETLSIVSSIACIEKYQKHNVCEYLAKQGQKILDQTNNIIKKFNCDNLIEITGHPSWSFLIFKDFKKYHLNFLYH
ncbi:MAG: aminotransferase class III-fold pyridoxal phosphate-dependent enzyme, partial [Alphaproteobacteria bacterium]